MTWNACSPEVELVVALVEVALLILELVVVVPVLAVVVAVVAVVALGLFTFTKLARKEGNFPSDGSHGSFSPHNTNRG